MNCSRPLVALAALLFAVVPSTASAQAVAAGARNGVVNYAAGGPSQNGYMDAQVEFQWRFLACSEGIGLIARSNAQVHMVVGRHRYWYNGKQYDVPSHINAPNVGTVTITGTARGPSVVRSTSLQVNAASKNCFTDAVIVLPRAQAWPANATDEEKLRILEQYGWDLTGARLPALRNPAVEEYIRAQLADAREDSLARASSARRDSIARANAQRVAQQRADSLARASQQRQTAGSAGSAGAATAAPGTTSANSRGQAQQSEADRAAADQAAADARVAEMQEYLRQQAAAEEARQQQAEQMAEAGAQVAVAAFGLVESIMESRASAKAERERIERQRVAAANAAYAAYVAQAKARFDAAPARPQCTVSASRDTMKLVLGGDRRTVRLTGDECRLRGGQSAVMIAVSLESDAPVVFKTSSSAYETIHLLDSRSNRWIFTGREEYVALNAERGDYVLFVTSRNPGEVGEITVEARTGWISDVQGSVGGAWGPAQPINGFVGTNTTSSSWMDLTLGIQSRVTWPYLYFSLMIPTDTDAQEGHVDLGLRQYFGPLNASVKPWIEASFGYREIFVLQESFRTFSPAVGVGLNWRLNEGNGLALSATYVTGEAKNNEDIWSSPPPPVKLNRTIVRVGWLLY